MDLWLNAGLGLLSFEVLLGLIYAPHYIITSTFLRTSKCIQMRLYAILVFSHFDLLLNWVRKNAGQMNFQPSKASWKLNAKMSLIYFHLKDPLGIGS